MRTAEIIYEARQKVRETIEIESKEEIGATLEQSYLLTREITRILDKR